MGILFRKSIKLHKAVCERRPYERLQGVQIGLLNPVTSQGILYSSRDSRHGIRERAVKIKQYVLFPHTLLLFTRTGAFGFSHHVRSLLRTVFRLL